MCSRQYLLRSPVPRDHHPPHGHSSSAGPELCVSGVSTTVLWPGNPGGPGCQPALPLPTATAGSIQWTCPCGGPFSSSQVRLGMLQGIPTILQRPGLKGFCCRHGRCLREAPWKQGGQKKGGCVGAPQGLLPPCPLRASRPTPQGLPTTSSPHGLLTLQLLRASCCPIALGPSHNPVPSGPSAAPMHLKTSQYPVRSQPTATPSPQGLQLP